MKVEQFTKHPQEFNKDHKAVQEVEERWNSHKKYYKNTTRARKGTTTQKMVNPSIAKMYKVILTKVKKLFAASHYKIDRVVIELPLEGNPLDNSGIHCFITASFYFYLECDVRSNFRIEYLFHNCEHQQEIELLIHQFGMKAYSTEVVKLPDYPTFFQNCLKRNPERFITLL